MYIYRWSQGMLIQDIKMEHLKLQDSSRILTVNVYIFRAIIQAQWSSVLVQLNDADFERCRRYIEVETTEQH